MKILKVGLFGGSFNPIHNDHIRIIKNLLKKRLVDEVWLVPCKNHAFNKKLAPAKERIEMINLVIKNTGKRKSKLKNKIKICGIELESKGKNYTIDMIIKLKKRYSHRFYLIAGSDITHEIKKWHEYRQLLKKIEFIILKRKGYRIKDVLGMKIASMINRRGCDISSTEIRERIKRGKSIKALVPKNVEKFINKRGLYKK